MVEKKPTKQGGLLYESVAKKIIGDIEKKIFLPGHKLSSEKELCRKHNVSHLTVRKALSLLVEQKYAVRRKGAGTFVADPALHHNKRLVPDDFIVVIVSNIRLSFLTELIESIELEANRRGRSVVLCNSHAGFSREVSYLQEHVRQGMMKFVVCPLGNDLTFYENLKKEDRLKMVFVDTTPDQGTIPVVKTDDVKGAYEATRYLMSIGHRNIVHLAGQKNFSSAGERVEGYTQAVGKKNAVILESGYSVTGGYNTVYNFIRAGRRPTAVFAGHDLSAVGARNALEDLGYRVPEDISVFGYGNLDIGKHYRLSTVNQQPALMGKLCVDVLETFMYDVKSLHKRLTVEHELIIRDSCRARKETKRKNEYDKQEIMVGKLPKAGSSGFSYP